MAAPLPPQTPQSNNNALIWGLVGCAGLLILGLCVATGVGAWFYLERVEQEASGPVVTVPGPAQPPGVGPAQPPGPGPMLPPPPSMEPNPRMVTATITTTSGTAPVGVGTTCSFAVERHARSAPPGYWCRAQITCGGLLLYGGPAAGFFPCELHEQPRRDVVGRDDSTTAMDTDASMELDTRQGTLTIRDDASGPFGAYSVEARVTDVR